MESAPSTDTKARKSIVSKLAEVMGEVGRIPKSGHNSFHDYDYATEADIVAAVRSGMAHRNLMLMPSVEKMEWREVPGKSGPQKVCTLTVRFSLLDGESGEKLEFTIMGEGQDQGDKATYKAMTGATKYALMKLFLIPTGDDPEKDEAHPPPPRRAPQQASAKTAAAAPPPAQPTQDGASQIQARARAKRIWDTAKSNGMDKVEFTKWVELAIGKPKPSAEWTPGDMDKLESELHQMSAKEADVPY